MNTNENNNGAQLAESQQEREQKAIRTATTILTQIKANPQHLSDSWAMEHPTATYYADAPALCFEVNALQHTGRVIVSLDEGRDLYMDEVLKKMRKDLGTEEDKDPDTQ